MYFANILSSSSLVKCRWRCLWHQSIDHLQVNILTNEACIVVHRFVVLCDILLPSRSHICLVRQVLVSLIDVVEHYGVVIHVRLDLANVKSVVYKVQTLV